MITLVAQGENRVSPSAEEFASILRHAINHQRFDDLIMIGDRADIAWMQLTLPREAAALVVAEIRYPLKREWFAEPLAFPALVSILEHLIT